MIIGIDFDNTIVCYEETFHRVAKEMHLISPSVPANKTAVREHLQSKGRNDLWTELQGIVYGPKMGEAKMYEGAAEFFLACRKKNFEVYIISHKTQFPFIGQKHDLHEAARRWLEANGFFDENNIGLDRDRVFFCPSREEKLKMIAEKKCSYFIDDLPEVFSEKSFPQKTSKFLFDPADVHSKWNGGKRVRSWEELKRWLVP